MAYGWPLIPSFRFPPRAVMLRGVKRAMRASRVLRRGEPKGEYTRRINGMQINAHVKTLIKEVVHSCPHLLGSYHFSAKESGIRRCRFPPNLLI
jgi:hypothetical protein